MPQTSDLYDTPRGPTVEQPTSTVDAIRSRQKDVSLKAIDNAYNALSFIAVGLMLAKVVVKRSTPGG